MIVDLLAEQTGEGIKALVYNTPFLASLSIFGVSINVSPYAPISGAVSSRYTQRIFILFKSKDLGLVQESNPNKKIIRKGLILFILFFYE
jgi:hypothetical protein